MSFLQPSLDAFFIAVWEKDVQTVLLSSLRHRFYDYRSISNSIFWAISSDVGNSFL